MSAWKQFERDAAKVFHGCRFWANSGERTDFAGEVRAACLHDCYPGARVSVQGQCKLVKRLSLEALTRLAEEVDVVCVKVRRGRGKPSPGLVVMTFEKYQSLHGGGPNVQDAAQAQRQ